MKAPKDLNYTRHSSLQKSILTGALLFLIFRLCAQDSLVVFQDSTAMHDTLRVEKEFLPDTHDVILDTQALRLNSEELLVVKKKSKEHSPRKATMYSAIFPGLGQAYNRQYWKIPLVYLGLGITYYFFDDYSKKYLHYKALHEEEFLKGDEKDEDLLFLLNEYKDFYEKWRNNNLIYMGLIYAANIIDALAFAHFYTYDISDDLTMRIRPSVRPMPDLAFNAGSLGISLKLTF